nr:GAF domain-containing SpoIIE family protein phosphatase [Patulibacter sp. SYSU D01012]
MDSSPEERFDRVTRLCRRLMGVDMALVNLIDDDRQWTKSVAGGQGLEISRRLSVCAHTILDPDGLEVEDLSADPRFRDVPYVADDPRLRFYAGVPLATAGGHRVGTLCVADRRPRRLTDADRALLRDLGQWAEQELSREDALARAAAIHGSLLPTRPPWDDAWEVAGRCRASPRVGGDFYDWHHGPDATVVALGGVAGHGMPAAIAMAVVRSALRAATRDEADPAAALGRLAAEVATEGGTAGRATGVLVLALRDGGRVACADAGHGRAQVVAPDGAVRPFVAGAPLGTTDGAAYAPTDVELPPGAVLVAWGAGLVLGDGPPTPATVGALVAGARSAEEAVARVTDAAAPPSASEDVTVVAVRRREAWAGGSA